jgi:formylglycine-generating enzyme required for sulfatase activity
MPDPFASALNAYRRSLIDTLSKTRYEIDTRFVRLTLLVDQGQEAQGTRFVEVRREYSDLRYLLAEIPERVLVLLGAPGSGKTTLLRHLQLDDTKDRLIDGASGVTWFVPLALYPVDAPDPGAWLASEWAHEHPDMPSFETLAGDGRLLLLLDALNEMRHRDRTELETRIVQWRSFLRPYTELSNRAVFTCRSLDYSIPLSSGDVIVRQATINPMSPAQVRVFLYAYLPSQQAEMVWSALQLPSNWQLQNLFVTPYFLKLLTEQVSHSDQVPRGRAALFTGFVRRALQREINSHHRLLTDPAIGLLDPLDIRQVTQHHWTTPHQLPERGLLIRNLSELAYRVQHAGVHGEQAQVRISTSEVPKLLTCPAAHEFIDAGVAINVLDYDIRAGQVFFSHQILQEYFAARWLAYKPEPLLVHSEWRTDHLLPALADVLKGLADYEPLPGAPATGWEDTFRMAAVMAPDPDAFIRDLAEVNLPLAGQCVIAPDVHVSAALRQQLQARLISRTQDRAADLRARVAAGQAMDLLGDPRFELRLGPYGGYVMPPMIHIPSGAYTVGDDDGQYNDEKPEHTVEQAAFGIGRFPVTNAEYRHFVGAGGYDDERWWNTDAARAWRRGEGQVEGQRQQWQDTRDLLKGLTEDRIRDLIKQNHITTQQAEAWIALRNWSDEQFEAWLKEIFPASIVYDLPRYWDDPDFNNPTQPVVGVCWHEARAYCSWLTAQVGLCYRLPTEAEWEAAARGLNGRAYAFGDSFDSSRCNTFESHIRRTTPVGVFPGGETPEGVVDLCGNVWEWTSSAYINYPYQHTQEREDPCRTDIRYRVLRGGSWLNDADYARVTSRFRGLPDHRINNIGFRIVAVSAQL